MPFLKVRLCNIMYQAVIFDLDGTILNTIDDLGNSANVILAAHGYPTHTIEQYKTFVGNGIPKLVERMLPPDVSAEEREKILAEFKQYYDLHKEDKTAPYAGILELLATLKAGGLKLCVLSNKQHYMAVQVVEHYFGAGTFDIIQGNSEQFPPKPDPTSCNAMIAQLGFAKDNILYIGDSNVDMQTAANVGLKKCGVSWGFRTIEELTAAGADYLIHTPQEIAGLALGTL